MVYILVEEMYEQEDLQHCLGHIGPTAHGYIDMSSNCQLRLVCLRFYKVGLHHEVSTLQVISFSLKTLEQVYAPVCTKSTIIFVEPISHALDMELEMVMIILGYRQIMRILLTAIIWPPVSPPNSLSVTESTRTDILLRYLPR